MGLIAAASRRTRSTGPADLRAPAEQIADEDRILLQSWRAPSSRTGGQPRGAGRPARPGGGTGAAPRADRAYRGEAQPPKGRRAS